MQPKRTIPRVCRQCSADFLASVSAVNSGKGLFCSVRCYNLAKQGRVLGPRTAVTRSCDHCGSKLTRQPHGVRVRNYCSSACRLAASHMAPHPIEFSEDGLTALVPLKTHEGTLRAHALVDQADAAWVGQWRWHMDKNGYAVREEKCNGRRHRVLLHRALLGLSASDNTIEGDHIDRNRLNCRRANLRAVSKAGNRQNVPGLVGATSAHRGVCWDKRSGRWLAQVKVGARNHVVGRFTDEIEAANAAREARGRLLPYAVD